MIPFRSKESCGSRPVVREDERHRLLVRTLGGCAAEMDAMTNQRPTYAEYRERLRQKAQEREIKDALQKKQLQERLKEHAVIALRDQIMLKLRLGQRLHGVQARS